MKDRNEVPHTSGGCRGLSLAAWVVVLLAVAFGTAAAARGPLTPPPLTDPGSWAAWAGGRTPLQAAFAVLGMVVMALAWYLLAVTVLTVAARLWGARRLLSLAELLTLPVVRRSLHAAIGLSLTSSALGSPAPVLIGIASASGGAGVADSATFPPPEGGSGPPPASPVMRRLPDGQAGPSVGEPAPAPTDWEVRPGDHLWSVAARTMAEAWGNAVSDEEVTPYWLEVVEANRDRLVDPGNTDLIVPGQILVLPAPPSPSR
ncbi:MAG: LysM peptidoglycan-binding domain-containing protein [Acidimicrobiales bacterium]